MAKLESEHNRKQKELEEQERKKAMEKEAEKVRQVFQKMAETTTTNNDKNMMLPSNIANANENTIANIKKHTTITSTTATVDSDSNAVSATSETKSKEAEAIALPNNNNKCSPFANHLCTEETRKEMFQEMSQKGFEYTQEADGSMRAKRIKPVKDDNDDHQIEMDAANANAAANVDEKDTTNTDTKEEEESNEDSNTTTTTNLAQKFFSRNNPAYENVCIPANLDACDEATRT
eukprot:760951_1